MNVGDIMITPQGNLVKIINISTTGMSCYVEYNDGATVLIWSGGLKNSFSNYLKRL